MIPLHKVNGFTNLPKTLEALGAVLASGWVGEGPKVAEFENALKPIVGSENVTALNSCTSALTLALRLAGVGPGDEVITTPMTCMATNLPILLAGATPVWADIDPTTGNIDPQSVEERVTRRTKAIMMVHWGGNPCDIAGIQQIASYTGIRVIEDAAHALGASYCGKPIGGHSDFVCFSFQAIKHIHTGDGGLLVCRELRDHARARSLRWFGIDREQRKVNQYGIAAWDVVEPGYKFHLNDIAATIGLAQLPSLPEILATRRMIAADYQRALLGGQRAKTLSYAPFVSANWLYTLLVDDQVGFIRYMREKGIDASIVHARNDIAPVFSHLPKRPLPGVDEFAGRMVCIPVGQWVTERERQEIIEAVTSEAW